MRLAEFRKWITKMFLSVALRSRDWRLFWYCLSGLFPIQPWRGSGVNSDTIPLQWTPLDGWKRWLPMEKKKKEILCSSWIWPRLRWVVAFPYVFMNVFGYAKRFLDDSFYVAAHLASFIPKREHNQPSSCCLILFSSYSFFFAPASPF